MSVTICQDHLYVFDLDETLIGCDSGVVWHQYLADKGIVDQGFLEQDQALMARYAAGELDLQHYIDFSVAALEGMTKQDVQQMVEECVQQRILPRAYPQALQLLAELKQQACQVIIVSATVDFIVAAVAKALGVEHHLAVDVAEQADGIGSQIVGIATYQQGKVERLKLWLEEQADSFEQTHFFTDSINDLPMCLHADRAYLINPCERLKQQGLHYDWPSFAWQV